MPNPDLVPLLLSTCTRRRYVEGSTGGQSTLTHEDQLGITCGIRPLTAELRANGYGVVPEADYLVTLHPEADVNGPDGPGGGTWDALLVTAGPYAGQQLKVRFVHDRRLIPSRKAEVQRLEQLPTSTLAP